MCITKNEDEKGQFPRNPLSPAQFGRGIFETSGEGVLGDGGRGSSTI
jgi:hypothetical protein